MHSETGRQRNLRYMMNYEAFSLEYGTEAPTEEMLREMFDNYIKSNLGVPQMPINRGKLNGTEWVDIDEPLENFGLLDREQWLELCSFLQRQSDEWHPGVYTYLDDCVILPPPVGYMDFPTIVVDHVTVASKVVTLDTPLVFKPESDEWYLYAIVAYLSTDENNNEIQKFQIRYGVKDGSS